jgi:choline dehydrogenase-like flavoprotein
LHGRHGEDPFEGLYSADYAHPPVEHEPRIQQLSDDLEKQGLHPFHLPIGLNLEQEADGGATRSSACIRCDRVDGFPCLVQAKSDSQVICVDPAVASGGIELLTGAYVERLETDARGRTVTGVVVRLDGTEERVTFNSDIVVVACGAVNSAALLLRSANDRHPNGLANGSDVVGRHYLRHNNLALMAVSKEPNPTRFQKTLALHDWYFGDEDWDYPLGGIQMLGTARAGLRGGPRLGHAPVRPADRRRARGGHVAVRAPGHRRDGLARRRAGARAGSGSRDHVPARKLGPEGGRRRPAERRSLARPDPLTCTLPPSNPPSGRAQRPCQEGARP